MRFEIRKEIDSILVTAPYNKEFAYRMRKMGGKWTGEDWKLPADVLEAAREAMRECFCRDDRSCDLVDVEITATEGRVYEETAFGLTIAQISSRDSGAWIPRDMRDTVSVLDGEITSGGSRKSPHIEIDRGTRILLRGIPKQAVEMRFDLNDNYTVKIVKTYGAGVDRASLMQEREHLLSRIKEIDDLIGE